MTWSLLHLVLTTKDGAAGTYLGVKAGRIIDERSNVAGLELPDWNCSVIPLGSVVALSKKHGVVAIWASSGKCSRLGQASRLKKWLNSVDRCRRAWMRGRAFSCRVAVKRSWRQRLKSIPAIASHTAPISASVLQ
jgi:hypothetical protein